ncbi:hypothetical protein [Bradyrhizobium symbiodeficiens]|uniref:hypothetical protein n=1 Tax=Bradyrhizobium symbiodeficiens TaxID=1404367 RepID=UPI00140F791E|nr:hypothetical protein [Bradyrhizobium symbiodeficiens]QIP02986.1 hypothetical protein HAU86_25775 [Bradyrhizobium symbiodeficiens]
MRWNLLALIAVTALSLTSARSAEKVDVQFLETTQSVQDDRNSIGLIAGKRTFVRAFVDYHGTSAASKVHGTIELRRAAGAVRTIDSLASVETTLDPSENGKLDIKRNRLDHSLVFEIPPDWNTVGDVTISLTGVSLHDGTRFVCTNCDKGTTATFKQGAAVRVVLLGLSYKRAGKIFVPRDVDYKAALSWLRRAYPSSDFEFQTRVVDWTTVPPSFDKGLKSCNIANATIAAIRKLDVASGTNALFHYYGLVYFDGSSELNFMRGCSSLPPTPDASAVGSGPAGVGYDWDSSPSFAGWYSGHELGHTFGRHHPVSGCGDLDEAGGDTGWPNKIPKNRLGSATEPFVAFDAGDLELPSPMTVWGWDKAADVMTYCKYTWPSAHNYVEICDRISAENGVQCPLSPAQMAAAGPAPSVQDVSTGPGGAPLSIKKKPGLLVPVADQVDQPVAAGGAISGPVISLTGRIDLDSGSGEISAVNRLDRSIEKAPTDKNAETPIIKSYDAQGRVLSEVPATVLLDSDRAASDPRTGLVSGEVPYSNDIARLELFYKDKPIAAREAAKTRPALSQPTADLPRLNDLLKGLNTLTAPGRQVDEFSKASGALTYTWQNQGSSSVKYTVQLSTNGGKDWKTVAVESPQHSITIDPSWIEGASTLDIRVKASDGIHETVSTSRPLDLTTRLPLQ